MGKSVHVLFYFFIFFLLLSLKFTKHQTPVLHTLVRAIYHLPFCSHSLELRFAVGSQTVTLSRISALRELYEPPYALYHDRSVRGSQFNPVNYSELFLLVAVKNVRSPVGNKTAHAFFRSDRQFVCGSNPFRPLSLS